MHNFTCLFIRQYSYVILKDVLKTFLEVLQYFLLLSTIVG